jgi:Mitochondrial carrier protein
VRLQLQGSYNNPAFFSGYNYKSTFHAIQTVCLTNHYTDVQIVRNESPFALYSGYRATMLRDLPYSALQFAFYEQFKNWSNRFHRSLTGTPRTISNHTPWEVINGMAAGGLAGFITTPLGNFFLVILLIA